MVKIKEDSAIDFVYETSDYSKFKILHGNRVINVLHLTNLKESLNKTLLKAIIYVNEKFEIIDGAHRFHALMDMKKPIHYIICENYGLKEVQIYNQNSKNWTMDDFLDSHVKLELKEYIAFKEFYDAYKLPISILFIIFWPEHKNIQAVFKAGKIKIKDIDTAHILASRLHAVRKIIGDIACKRDFVKAFIRVNNVPKYNHEQMIHKLELVKGSIKRMPSAYAYTEMLDNIYNFKQNSVKRLDILGYLRAKGYRESSVKKFVKK